MADQSEFKKKDKFEEEKEETSVEKINEFGREQIIITCQFCQRRILTDIEHETTWVGIGLSIALLLIFRIYSIILIILLIPLTQQTVHTCPNCLNKVGTRSFFDYISLTDKVITYKIGSFAIMITKKQILAVFIFLLLSIGFFLFFSNISITRGNIIPDTWSDFKSTCNKKNLSSANHELVEAICNEKYKYSDVSWNGYVIRIDYHENFFSKYKLSLLIKMQENSTDSEDPDFYLNFHDYVYQQYQNDIFNITRGDMVSFNATIASVGSVKSFPILEAFEFKKLEEHIAMHPHIHHHGRYSVDGDKDIKVGDSLYKELPRFVSDEKVDMNQLETDH